MKFRFKNLDTGKVEEFTTDKNNILNIPAGNWGCIDE